jgi:hypothetical protein
VLAYVFWHWPRAGSDTAAYESAQVRFQQSLVRQPPAGLRGNASFRIARVPWFVDDWTGARYEDWYLVEDWTALGVLEQAVVGAGHRSAHERAAAHAGGGAGGVYRLLEGASPALDAATATWVTAPAEHGPSLVGDLLADGGEEIAMWRRALVLGPAPEWCLLAGAAPRGVAASRLPVEWTALTLERVPVFRGD